MKASTMTLRLLRASLPAALLLAAAVPAAPAQGWTGSIRLNQVGFYPGAPKTAVVVGGRGGPAFHVTTPDLADTLFTGRLGAPQLSDYSSDTTRLADFSALHAPGSYVLLVPGLGYSHPFELRPRVHQEVARAALRAFYHNRASTPQPVAYAGAWARPAGHPDDTVRVHPSAASAQRPAGTVLSSPGGWYDAGDYNKYVVNSGITVATLLSLYEDFPEYAAGVDAGIPESGNAVPDVLDEALWNLRWMLTMQDSHDGGVYHKLTEAQFSAMAMPSEVRARRWLVQKSTAAALDFAAVMAQASRVLRRYEHALPGLADSTLTAATRAWAWARRNPAVLYDQNAVNERFDPDVGTGTYGDRNVSDEWSWAAAELYATTGQDTFATAVPLFPDSVAPVPSWSQVRTLGYYTLLRHRDRLGARAAAEVRAAERLVLARADSLVAGAKARAYRTPMGLRRDYVWGSSAVAANQGIALVQAYRLTGDPAYLRHALANLDYLLGRNATGYSFVTGHGGRTPQHPHHRPSAADGVEAPVPGWLAGGPNPGMQDRRDGCTGYPSTLPDQAYVDALCSFASNEVAINWNAPLVYLANALEALQSRIGRAK
jgi:endoglucanase